MNSCIPLTENAFFRCNNSLSSYIIDSIKKVSECTKLFTAFECLSEPNFSINSGSFSTVILSSTLCIRFTPASTGYSFCTRVVENIQKASVINLGVHIWGYGEISSNTSPNCIGVLVIMERLFPLPDTFCDEEGLFGQIERLNRGYFHNDLKLNNIMLESDKVRLIDFDYMHPSKIMISVSSYETIELDFAEFFKERKSHIHLFRTLYDYTTLSLSVDGATLLYPKLLTRLASIFDQLLVPVLVPLVTWLSPEQLKDMPMEVLVKCPGIEAVSVNILDLRGNAFAHNVKNWEQYPSLFKSNGVYWPGR